jgi:hypothetical protein
MSTQTQFYSVRKNFLVRCFEPFGLLLKIPYSAFSLRSEAEHPKAFPSEADLQHQDFDGSFCHQPRVPIED